MTMYTYGVIRGERQLLEYCRLRWKGTPLFVESFSHNLFPGYIERLYCKSPTDDGFHPYYIMAIEDNNGGECDQSRIRETVYRAVSDGTQRLVELPGARKTQKQTENREIK